MGRWQEVLNAICVLDGWPDGWECRLCPDILKAEDGVTVIHPVDGDGKPLVYDRNSNNGSPGAPGGRGEITSKKTAKGKRKSASSIADGSSTTLVKRKGKKSPVGEGSAGASRDGAPVPVPALVQYLADSGGDQILSDFRCSHRLYFEGTLAKAQEAEKELGAGNRGTHHSNLLKIREGLRKQNLDTGKIGKAPSRSAADGTDSEDEEGPKAATTKTETDNTGATTQTETGTEARVLGDFLTFFDMAYVVDELFDMEVELDIPHPLAVFHNSKPVAFAAILDLVLFSFLRWALYDVWSWLAWVGAGAVRRARGHEYGWKDELYSGFGGSDGFWTRQAIGMSSTQWRGPWWGRQQSSDGTQTSGRDGSVGAVGLSQEQREELMQRELWISENRNRFVAEQQSQAEALREAQIARGSAASGKGVTALRDKTAKYKRMKRAQKKAGGA